MPYSWFVYRALDGHVHTKSGMYGIHVALEPVPWFSYHSVRLWVLRVVEFAELISSV